jgi:hypothetical protein
MDENGKAGKVKAGPIKSLCSNLDQQLYSPIVSKDGKFVGVESDSGQTIYKVDGDNCKVVHSLEVTTGKISFDFPRGWFQKNRPPRFTYSSHMIDEGSYSFGENVGMLYDPKTEKNIRISPNVPGSISYPGFAKDGKIVMLRYGSGGNELLTVDADKITDLYNKDKKAYNAALGLNCTKPGSPSSSPTSTIPASGSSSGSGTD